MSLPERSAKSQSKYEHTERISERRKALFPEEHKSTSDSGCASQQQTSDSDSNFSDIQALDNLEFEISGGNYSFFKHTVGDYILVDRSESSGEIPDVHGSESNMSPLCLTPNHPLVSSPLLYSPQQSVEPSTPMGKSPTSSLKTPNDTTVKINVKHQKRKSQDAVVDSTETDKSMSPLAKTPKLDTSFNKPKVCTALFPELEDAAVPTKPLYLKNPERTDRANVAFKRVTKRSDAKSARRRREKKQYGQINAGVRHNIKKPKRKIVTKEKVMQTALGIIEKSPLTEYLNEMTLLTMKKQITEITPTVSSSLCNTETVPLLQGDKENVNAEDKNDTVCTSKKFFKSRRSHGAVTNNTETNEQLKEPLGEITNNQRKTAIDELSFEDDPSMEMDINHIITNLDSSTGEHAVSPFHSQTKKRPAPVARKDEDLILSPTSQMCDMASGLALNSPKRARLNISAILEGADSATDDASSVDMERGKLFPVFYGSCPAATGPKPEKKASEPKARWRNLPADQMLLDAGQKRFGLKQCEECQIVYHMGDPNEELTHLKYHNATNVFKFQGWKNERVVANLFDARIVRIMGGDSKAWWKKVREVIEVVNRDLGFCEDAAPLNDQNEIYLYIKNKQIAGCLVAEPKSAAYKMLTSDTIDMCSEMSYPVKCGVSRIWVAKNNRKCGVATAMMNCLRKTYIYGYIMANTDVAISAPTDLGKQFARAYFKTDHYLVYLS